MGVESKQSIIKFNYKTWKVKKKNRIVLECGLYSGGGRGAGVSSECGSLLGDLTKGAGKYFQLFGSLILSLTVFSFLFLFCFGLHLNYYYLFFFFRYDFFFKECAQAYDLVGSSSQIPDRHTDSQE